MKIIAVLLSLFLFWACGSSSKNENSDLDMMPKTDFAKKEVPPSTATGTSANMTPAQTNEELTSIIQNEASPTEEPKATAGVEKGKKYPKKLIREANLAFEVENLKLAQKEIPKLVSQYGRYISNEKLLNDTYQMSNEIEIRVPVEKFDSLIARLESKGKRLDSKEVKVIDITQDYYDLDARLNAKKTFEARYFELLKQAKNIKDILEVETQIRNLREEIDICEGHLRLWNDQISYSTIYLKYYQKLDYQYIPSEHPRFFQRIASSLNEGWTSFLSFVVILVGLWPFWIVLTLAIYFIRRYRRLRKNNKESKEVIKLS